MYHNDLLIGWLVLKGQALKKDFDVLDWVLQVQEDVEADLDTSRPDFDERVTAEVENTLITAIIDGQRTGHWPWTK